MDGEPEIKHLDPAKAVRLYNTACLYCGRPFGPALKRTTEHIIGRRFVPSGSLDRHWNLIASACLKCNGIKSGLENDISALTMQPDVLGRHPQDDEVLRSEGIRKGAGAISEFTKKCVAKSRESLAVETPLLAGVPRARMRFSFTGPPTFDEDRAFRLAWYQVAGFFYWITYKKEKGVGCHWLGSFMPLMLVRESDWGNTLMRSFQELVSTWGYRVFGGGDYFAVCLKRSPDSRPLWSWALEWNRTFRLIGFAGNEEAAQQSGKNLVWPKSQTIRDGPNSWLRFRQEQRISDQDDRLFAPPLMPVSPEVSA